MAILVLNGEGNVDATASTLLNVTVPSNTAATPRVITFDFGNALGANDQYFTDHAASGESPVWAILDPATGNVLEEYTIDSDSDLSAAIDDFVGLADGDADIAALFSEVNRIGTTNRVAFTTTVQGPTAPRSFTMRFTSNDTTTTIDRFTNAATGGDLGHGSQILLNIHSNLGSTARVTLPAVDDVTYIERAFESRDSEVISGSSHTERPITFLLRPNGTMVLEVSHGGAATSIDPRDIIVETTHGTGSQRGGEILITNTPY
jgi:hypothetical protein